MKKGLLGFIVIAVVMIIAIGVYKKDVSVNSAEVQKWNPYANEIRYQRTLNDFLISAVNGNYMVKMTVTLEFKDQDSLKKFEGAPSQIEKEKGKQSEEKRAYSPMEIKANSLINTYMLQEVVEKNIANKQQIEKGLIEYLNKELHMEESFIQNVYIENYVFQ